MSMKKSPKNHKKADVKMDEKAAGSQEAAATPAPTVRRRSSTAKRTRNAKKADDKAHEVKMNLAKEADQADPADLVVSSASSASAASFASSAPSSPASAMNDVVQTAADPEGSGQAEDWDAIPDPVVDSGSCDIEKEDADGGTVEDVIEDDKADDGTDADDISLLSSESASVPESSSVRESAHGIGPASRRDPPTRT